VRVNGRKVGKTGRSVRILQEMDGNGSFEWYETGMKLV
jgi:hypothetical protein